jgi:hypothetical protein
MVFKILTNGYECPLVKAAYHIFEVRFQKRLAQGGSLPVNGGFASTIF